ncbi:MAG: family oxidoreductase [Ilumatobacteraceae bacterium]|nr:family oxidoreductase [Ilumatobacteraceae bacterium]
MAPMAQRTTDDVISGDTIVIGGGSGGAVVAGRLAAAGRDVVLVEAGPDYGPFGDPRWPAELIDARTLAITHDWGYAHDRWTYERARVIGGCSSHNGAIAAVGHRRDYDNWGMPGWSGDDVAPAFQLAVERMRVRTYGPDEVVPFHRECLIAAEDLGWRMASDLCDLDANDSFGLESVNVVGTTRWNTAFAYLDPVRGGGSLRIVDHTTVDRIESTAGGTRVVAHRLGQAVTMMAGTVVLAAGVYGTPAILQRSGVGDPDHLRSIGVTPTLELPGVGANLHDHSMMHAARAIGDELQNFLDETAARGFLPEEQTLGKALSSFAASADGDGLYDMHVFPVCGSDQTSMLSGRVAVEVACLTPHSRGSVRIVSADPHAAPAIDHRYLSDDGGHDLAVLRDGLVLAEQILDHPDVRSLLGGRVTDSSTDEAIRANVAHYYHPVGTCAMGSGPAAVCDERGRVRGMPGVVVADASLIPTIPRANTNLPVVMIGEIIAATL